MNYVRDASKIKSILYEKDNKIYTKEKLIIEFPKWYEDKELLSLGDQTYLYGVFALIKDNFYSVSTIPTLIQVSPTIITEIKKGEEIYTQFIFGENKIVIENTQVVKQELLSYNMFSQFFLNAKIPWYISYDDLVKIMDNLPGYAKSQLGDNWIANELVISFITRYKENKALFHRQKIDEDYDFVDLNNVYYSAISTLNKLAGNYFSESLVSALVQKEREPTKLEMVVRK